MLHWNQKKENRGKDTHVIPLRVKTNELSSLHVTLDVRELVIKKNLDNRRQKRTSSSQIAPQSQAFYLSVDPVIWGLSILSKKQF